ncbi:MAG: amidohydrolase family protein [Deltaproteobacteria bacterium]|nr:amidohydrolase family protein [Deltaproteobacteria bacterium]
MIIDFHTHLFPHMIAEDVLADVEENTGLPAKALGTKEDIRDHMDSSGTDVSIVLAAAPEPKFVKKTNDWLLSIQDERIQFFGTVLPGLEGWEEELMRLKKESVKGIKFNALFQNIRPDDEEMFPIYEKMMEENMIALFHAGASYKDRNHPEKILATPKRISKVVDTFPDLKVIAAHFGGNHVLDQMKEHLLGKNVYFDTSYPPDVYALDPKLVTSIVHKHGSERILFGTDYPWETQTRGIQYIRSLGLTEKEESLILGENAYNLLFETGN